MIDDLEILKMNNSKQGWCDPALKNQANMFTPSWKNQTGT